MKLAFSLLTLAATPLIAGELTSLSDKPWVGWYCGYEGKKFHFGVDPDGKAALIPLNKKGERFPQHAWATFKPVIVETWPSGKSGAKRPLGDGWELITESSTSAETISFRGTIEGGATFEASFEIDGNNVSCKGHIIDKGAEAKNPQTFGIQINIPNLYRHTKEREDLLDRIKGDRLSMVMADKKKAKLKGDDPLSEAVESCKDIKAVTIDFDSFGGPKLSLESGNTGSLNFVGKTENLVSEGFTLLWAAEPSKDTKGSDLLTVEFK